MTTRQNLSGTDNFTTRTTEQTAPPLGWLAEATVRKHTLTEGKSAGMELIEVDNGRLRIALLPGRGMGLWKIWVDGIDVGWQSPVCGPVHPMYVPLFAPDGRGWLEGFDEVLCRCGLRGNGPPVFAEDGRLAYPMHGRIANLPASQVAAATDPVSGFATVTGVVHESSLRGGNLALHTRLSLRPHALAFDLCDTVTNHGGEPATIQLLYHYNLGMPILGPNARLVAPVISVTARDADAARGLAQWASFTGPQTGFQEQVFFAELHSDAEDNTLVLLKNPDSTLAASMGFNRRQLPCFTLWKNTAAMGDGYVAGLEPGTNFPNPRATELEAGHSITLAPGQSATFDLVFGFHTTALEVQEVEQKIAVMAGRANGM